MSTLIESVRTPQAIAEVFWLAFSALDKPEQDAVLKRLLSASTPTVKLSPQPAGTLLALRGLVQWGGDAVADSEALYDIDHEYAPLTRS